ncbi:hypothetical protein J2X84_003212 [Pseudomonas corrugata]|uniref:hypothetical protein n=1 Tax=Pseudomonas corrugata TaxID=47879 RepID=UPI00285B5CA8|nr:hypothetical protein [Pseudomonas corrugata]MDR7284374.1 hypothetical protein [Pseudomonas corrugata]
MHRISSAAIALSLLFAFSNPASADTPALNEARTLVAKVHMGRNLPALALSTAQGTVSYSMIAEKLGADDANRIVSEEITALLPKYQPEWDENLARAYEKSFSEEELASLVAEGPASQYVEKVKAQQATVGGEMRSTSEPIVAALVTEALKATMEKRMP